MLTLGSAILYLSAKSEGLDKDLAQAEGKTKTVLNRLATTVKESMNFAVGQVISQGMNQLAAGIQKLATDTVRMGMKYTEQVEEMARLTGASAEDASRMIQVADDLFVEYGDLSTALKLYSKAQKDAGAAGNITIKSLAALSDQYLKLKPGIERANFLLSNFGKNGLEMGKVMEVGGEKIRTMAAGVEDGLIVTEKGIKATKEYKKAMDEWNDTIAEVQLMLYGELQPYLEKFSNWLATDGKKALMDFAEGFAKLPGPVKAIIFAVAGLLVLLTTLGPALMGIAGIVSLLGGGGAAAGGGGLLAGLAAGITALGAPVVALAIAIGALIGVIIIAGPAALESFKKIAMLGPMILVLGLQRTIDAVKKWVKTFLDNIRSLGKLSAEEWKKIGAAIPAAILGGIKAEWNLLIAGVKELINALLKQFNLQLEIKSPSKVFERVGVLSAAGYGQGFASEMADQVRSQVLGSLGGFSQASDARTMIGPVEFHGNLTMTERRLLYGSVEEHTQRELLRSLKHMKQARG